MDIVIKLRAAKPMILKRIVDYGKNDNGGWYIVHETSGRLDFHKDDVEYVKGEKDGTD